MLAIFFATFLLSSLIFSDGFIILAVCNPRTCYILKYLTCCMHVLPCLIVFALTRIFIVQFIIGDGSNLYDFTYVENVVHAHVCAERALASGGEVSAKAAGQAFGFT